MNVKSEKRKGKKRITEMFRMDERVSGDGHFHDVI